MIKGKVTEIPKLLLISDLYLCLFEIDKKAKGNAILTFWSNIRALINIKIIINENLGKFVWRNQLENQKMYELWIITPNGEEIQGVILKNMNQLGITYNVNKRQSEAMRVTGAVPPTDLALIEKQIEDIEKEIQTEPSIEKIKQLNDLYENVIYIYHNSGCRLLFGN